MEVLGFGAGKMVELCKQNFIGHYHRSLEDSHTKSNVVYGGPAQEVSEGNSISNGTRNHCDVLTKKCGWFMPLS